MVIAYHLILTAYGQWLPNDPRGSMSRKVVAGKLDELGPMHPGRKRIQPGRAALKSFYRKAQRELEHCPLWFDETKRSVIPHAFREMIRIRRYTCFACAILVNHAHLVIRKHRDKAETMIIELKKESATRLRRLADAPDNHPVWSGDQFKRFLSSGGDIRRTIRYVRENPTKEGLGPQDFPFVKEYRGEWDRGVRT
ncbi:MAG: hypothetical protein V3W34_09605 [Phycisphaerae bacterium]